MPWALDVVTYFPSFRQFKLYLRFVFLSDARAKKKKGVEMLLCTFVVALGIRSEALVYESGNLCTGVPVLREVETPVLSPAHYTPQMSGVGTKWMV